MKARSFSHCGITVSNFNQAVQFYWEVFGCPLVGVADTPPDRVRSFFGLNAEQPSCKIGWIRVPGGAVLEINAEPSIALHRAPLCDPPRPVAEAIIASLFPSEETGRLTLVAVLHAPATSDARIANALIQLRRAAGVCVGHATSGGAWLDGVPLATRGRTLRDHVQSLWLHPRTEEVVVELHDVVPVVEPALPLRVEVGLVDGSEGQVVHERWKAETGGDRRVEVAEGLVVEVPEGEVALARVVEQVLRPAPGLLSGGDHRLDQLEAHGVGVEAVARVDVPSSDRDVMEGHASSIARCHR